MNIDGGIGFKRSPKGEHFTRPERHDEAPPSCPGEGAWEKLEGMVYESVGEKNKGRQRSCYAG